MFRNRKALGAVFLALLALPVQAGVITITNAVTGNFDGNSGTRGLTVTGLEPGFGSGTITNVTAIIDFAKADGESFEPPFPGGTPFFNEIHFRLDFTSSVELITANAFNTGSGPNFFDGVITFNDSAANVVNVNPNQPQAGTFRPIGSLATFNGMNAAGTWTLFIEDTTGADALRFRSVTLDITTDGAPVPEPASIMLTGMGVLALAGFQLRRRKLN